MAKKKPRSGKAATKKSRNVADRKPTGQYQFEIASREALMDLLQEAGRPLTHEQVADALEMYQRDEKFDALGKRLGAMTRDGQIVRNRRGGFVLVDEQQLIRGRVSAHPDGYGFLIKEQGDDDIYLSARQMRRVLDGDRVVVHITGTDNRGRSEGAIVEVVERANKTLVGKIEINRGVAVLHPDNKRIGVEILVSDAGAAKNGQIVLVEIVEQPTNRRPPIGQVIEVLGEHMAPGMEIDIAIRSRDIPDEWPQEVVSQAGAIGVEVSQSAIAERRDIRSTPLVTIDGEDARDFDDAVFAEAKPYGWRLVVAIADVSHYVEVDSPLDREAYKRGTSVYFPQRVIPMLPESLSNGLCSLNPDVNRLCMVCDMGITHEGTIKRARFYPATMRSHARLTYTEVAAFVQGDKKAIKKIGTLGKHIKTLHELYVAMRAARAERGAIDFDSSETRIVFDDQAKIQQLVPVERNDAHMMIEECMIAANISAAKFIARNRIPGLFRVHEGPGEDKLVDVRKFLQQRGLSLGGGDKPQAKDYAQTLYAARDRADLLVIQTVLLRSMNQAVYTTRDSGHFGLALEHYAHFTSPIRRYPDLMVHRAIKHVLKHRHKDGFHYDSTAVAEIGDHCSVTERRAEAAVRDVISWLKCEYMQDHIGSSHEGVISGVTSFGVFVELRGVHVEGLVHITSLPKDYYEFDPVSHRLRGRAGGREFGLGQVIQVLVAAVNVDERKIDFQIDSDAVVSGNKPKRGKGKADKGKVDKGRSNKGKGVSAKQGNDKKGKDKKRKSIKGRKKKDTEEALDGSKTAKQTSKRKAKPNSKKKKKKVRQAGKRKRRNSNP